MWFLPAVLGAVLGWSRWLILVLLVPGLIWYVATQGLRCYEEIREANPTAPIGYRVPALYSLPLFIGAIVFFPERLVGVFIVTGFVFVDLAWWSRAKRRMGDTGESVGTSQ
jgi:hypothetical protein